MSDLREVFWLERVDGGALAACCYVEKTHNGVIYGAGTFILLDGKRRGWEWRRLVAEKLRDEIARRVHVTERIKRGGYCLNYRGMPEVGRVRDLNRA